MQDITDFNFNNRPGWARPGQIDWLRLLDGGVHKLVKGIDYHGDTQHKRRTIQNRARMKGKKLRTCVVDDGQAIVAQAIETES